MKPFHNHTEAMHWAYANANSNISVVIGNERLTLEIVGISAFPYWEFIAFPVEVRK